MCSIQINRVSFLKSSNCCWNRMSQLGIKIVWITHFFIHIISCFDWGSPPKYLSCLQRITRLLEWCLVWVSGKPRPSLSILICGFYFISFSPSWFPLLFPNFFVTVSILSGDSFLVILSFCGWNYSICFTCTIVAHM